MIISTLSIFGSILFGPREENEAMTGAGLTPRRVLALPIATVGLSVELTYFRMAMASSDETPAPGRTWASTGISFPFAGLFASMMAAPPALFTSIPFATRNPAPLKHTTTLPAAFRGEREFGRHWLQIDCNKISVIN